MTAGELIAGVVVPRGSIRQSLVGGTNSRSVVLQSLYKLDLSWLTINGHYDGAVKAVF